MSMKETPVLPPMVTAAGGTLEGGALSINGGICVVRVLACWCRTLCASVLALSEYLAKGVKADHQKIKAKEITSKG